MHASMDPDIASLLEEIRTGIAAALDDAFVGLYLFGSLVYGDFTPGVSDIDLLAVSRRFATVEDIDRLRVMHRRLVEHHPEWHDRIEVAYQSLHGLRAFRTERSPVGIISPGEPLHLTEAGDEWLMNWYFVLDHGVTLTGPPPERLIPSISRDDFVRATRKHAHEYARRVRSAENQRAESYAILTVCRAFYTHHTSDMVSKIEAARWVQARHPEWSGLIEMALERRVSPDDNRAETTFHDTVRFIEQAVAEIEEGAP